MLFQNFAVNPKYQRYVVRVKKTNLNIFSAARRAFLYRTDIYFSKYFLKLAVKKALCVREEKYCFLCLEISFQYT